MIYDQYSTLILQESQITSNKLWENHINHVTSEAQSTLQMFESDTDSTKSDISIDTLIANVTAPIPEVMFNVQNTPYNQKLKSLLSPKPERRVPTSASQATPDKKDPPTVSSSNEIMATTPSRSPATHPPKTRDELMAVIDIVLQCTSIGEQAHFLQAFLLPPSQSPQKRTSNSTNMGRTIKGNEDEKQNGRKNKEMGDEKIKDFTATPIRKYNSTEANEEEEEEDDDDDEFSPKRLRRLVEMYTSPTRPLPQQININSLSSSSSSSSSSSQYPSLSSFLAQQQRDRVAQMESRDRKSPSDTEEEEEEEVKEKEKGGGERKLGGYKQMIMVERGQVSEDEESSLASSMVETPRYEPRDEEKREGRGRREGGEGADEEEGEEDDRYESSFRDDIEGSPLVRGEKKNREMLDYAMNMTELE